MFERFTDGARRTIVMANQEARGLGHNYIGTEHLLLGVLAESDGAGAEVLRTAGVDTAGVRTDLEATIGRGTEDPKGHIPFTPRAKAALEQSLREAMTLEHEHIGVEHVLLGLLRQEESVGVASIRRLGADPKAIVRAVLAALA